MQGPNSKLTGYAHLYRIFSVLRVEELPPPLQHRRWGSRLDTRAAESGVGGGRKKEGREGETKEGKEGRGGSKAGAVCTRLLGKASLAPPTSVGDCDVIHGTSRLFQALRINGNVRPSPGDRVNTGPLARPHTSWATVRDTGCGTLMPSSRTNRSFNSGSSQTAPAKPEGSSPGPQNPSPQSLVQ